MCWHKWKKWARPILAFSGHKLQWRECEKCGKAQHRTLWWDGQCDVPDINAALDAVHTRADTRPDRGGE
jgi:hypothetical protein